MLHITDAFVVIGIPCVSQVGNAIYSIGGNISVEPNFVVHLMSPFLSPCNVPSPLGDTISCYGFITKYFFSYEEYLAGHYLALLLYEYIQ